MILPVIFVDDEVPMEDGRGKAIRVNCIVSTFLVLTTIASVILSIKDPLRADLGWGYICLIKVQSVTLIPFVLFLKRQINRVQPKLTKVKLIMTHLINCLIWALLQSGLGLLRSDQDQEESTIFFSFKLLDLVFTTYFQLFLIYLVTSFTRNI